MTIPNSITLQLSVNGGAQRTGGIPVADGASVVLSAVSTSGISSLRYEITDFPQGFGTPSGWTFDGIGTYYVVTSGAPAPAITAVGADTIWGKYMLRLLARRSADTTYNLLDETTAFETLSPSRGLHGIAYREANQFHPKGWPVAMQQALQSLETAGAGVLINAASGIGTLAAPGVLRGLIGSGALKTVHVGGFWTLADSGGGPFYWDAASTATDDGGTVINPTGNVTGRWKRIFNGDLHVDWFGAVGDGTRDNATSGTDDADAIQLCINAAAAVGKSVHFDAGKVYRVEQRTAAGKKDPVLDCSQTFGMCLTSSGGPKFLPGAWIKVTGHKTDCLVSAMSTIGFGCVGLTFSTGAVLPMTTLLHGCDYVHANQAARLAGPYVLGDIGKLSHQTDTNANWFLNALPGTGAGDWLPESINVIDLRHHHAGASDSNLAHIRSCSISGGAGLVITSAVRLADCTGSSIEKNQFAYFKSAIMGVDGYYGGAFSNTNSIIKNTFNGCPITVLNPHTAFTVKENVFEADQATSLVSTVLVNVAGAIGLNIKDNMWADGINGGTCIDLTGVQGATITGNCATDASVVGIFVKMVSCSGIVSHGNNINLAKAYNPISGNSNIHIGPDQYNGAGVYISGTGYTDSIIKYANGMSIGGPNTVAGIEALAIGDSNNVHAQSAFAIGIGNDVGGLFGMAFGAYADVDLNSTTALGGGNVFGVGGAMARWMVCTQTVTNGANTALFGTNGGAPTFPMKASRTVAITVRCVAIDAVASPTKGFMTTYEILVSKATGGTVTILDQHLVTVRDPAATGCSVDAVVNGSGIDFRFNNTSGSTLRVVASFEMTQVGSA